MNKDELKQKIIETEKVLAEMREELDKREEQWNPKGGDWFIGDSGSVIFGDSIPLYANYGIEFQTESDAKDAVKVFRRFHRLYHLALELNEEWKPDWEDTNQNKYFIVYDYYYDRWVVQCSSYSENFITPVFRSMETAKEAIRLITECNALEG